MNSHHFIFKNLCFIVFTKNEENSIGTLVNELKREAEVLQIKNHQVLVIDDSTDLTKHRATEAGALVFEGPGLGLGAAYKFGLQKCFELKPQPPEVIVTLDGDGQVLVAELKRFLDALQTSDLVIGSRFLNRNGILYNYPKLNHFGSRMLSAYLTFMTGQKITDSHGGFRTMRLAAAQSIKISGDYTYVQESIIDVSEAGFRVTEIGSDWGIRKHGVSRIVNSIPRYVRRVGPILAKRFLRKVFTGKSA